MRTLDDVIKSLPDDTRETIRYVWESLPPSERNALQLLLNGIPTEANLLRLLLSMSTVQLKRAFGRKHRVAIVGPVNVGKSTLYNQLVQKKEDRALVSPIPGTTRKNQLADAGLFGILDTPGADAVGSPGLEDRSQAYKAASEADFLVIMFDAVQGVKKNEQDLFTHLASLGKPFIVVMNKMDLVGRDGKKVIEQSAVNLNLKPEQVIPVAAKDGKNLSPLLTAIVMTEPELFAALGQTMPGFRWQLAWRSIVSSASISAVIALTPLPVIDFAPLVITQSIMVLGIARIYNYQITIQRAKEIVATFGLGLIGRTLFQQLSKLGGVPGWILSAAIAASTTVVMGIAAAQWFERGERLSAGSLRKMSQNLTILLVDSLRGLGKRKPGKESLKERITETLEQSPVAANPSLLDNQV